MEFYSVLLESFDEYIDKFDFIPKRYFIKLNYSLNNKKIDPIKCLDIYIKAINQKIKVITNLLTCLFDKIEKKSNIKKLICSLIGNNNYDNFILSKFEFFVNYKFELLVEISELLLNIRFKDISTSITNLILNNLNKICTFKDDNKKIQKQKYNIY